MRTLFLLFLYTFCGLVVAGDQHLFTYQSDFTVGTPTDVLDPPYVALPQNCILNGGRNTTVESQRVYGSLLLAFALEHYQRATFGFQSAHAAAQESGDQERVRDSFQALKRDTLRAHQYAIEAYTIAAECDFQDLLLEVSAVLLLVPESVAMHPTTSFGNE